jgi:hypothetical protein
MREILSCSVGRAGSQVLGDQERNDKRRRGLDSSSLWLYEAHDGEILSCFGKYLIVVVS